MKTLRFEWDPAKAEKNVKQHGVSFQEAQTVFYDDFAVEFYDDKHAEWEDRFCCLDSVRSSSSCSYVIVTANLKQSSARLKQQATLRLGNDVVDYFKTIAEEIRCLDERQKHFQPQIEQGNCPKIWAT